MPLVDHFRKQFTKRHKKSVKGISPEVTKRLFSYDWPGNVRQLRNAVETMVVLDIDGVLDLDDLPPELAEVDEAALAQADDGRLGLIGKSMEDIEQWAITETLKLTNNNREEAARILAIGSRTLYRKLEKYQIGKDGEVSAE